MPYEITHREPLSDALRRIAGEQIERIAAELERMPRSPDQSVHNARRRIKETRALLRLFRRMLGDRYADANVLFRDLARQFAGSRDLDAALKLVTAIRGDLIAAAGGHGYRSARSALRHRARQSHPAMSLEAIDAARDSLQRAQDALSVPLPPAVIPAADFESIAPGLEKTYSRGHGAFSKACNGGATEDFHEWRKHVKDTGYHLQLLAQLEPSLLQAHRDHLVALARLLGEHHDLWVLDGLLQRTHFRTPARKSSLLDVIAARMRNLEAAACQRGRVIYAETPKAFVSRFRHYWDATS